MTNRYKLKPGKHQFAPGSHAVHDNDSLIDDDAAWYLERYPHIAALFEPFVDVPKLTLFPGKPKRPRKLKLAAL